MIITNFVIQSTNYVHVSKIHSSPRTSVHIFSKLDEKSEDDKLSSQLDSGHGLENEEMNENDIKATNHENEEQLEEVDLGIPRRKESSKEDRSSLKPDNDLPQFIVMKRNVQEREFAITQFFHNMQQKRMKKRLSKEQILYPAPFTKDFQDVKCELKSTSPHSTLSNTIPAHSLSNAAHQESTLKNEPNFCDTFTKLISQLPNKNVPIPNEDDKINSILTPQNIDCNLINVNNTVKQDGGLLWDYFSDTDSSLHPFDKKSLFYDKFAVELVHACEIQNEKCLFLKYYPLTLHKYLKNRLMQGPMDMEEIRYWSRSIVSIVFELHSKGYVHRDIKPENIFLQWKGRSPTSKVDILNTKILNYSYYECRIGDFEFCKKIDRNALTKTQLGSYYYLPPEIVDGNDYNSNVDSWSIGVICLTLLLGYNPLRYKFSSQMTQENIMEVLSSQQETLDIEALFQSIQSKRTIPNVFVDFIKCLLDRNAASRMTVMEAMSHPFLLNDTIDVDTKTDTPTSRSKRNTKILYTSKDFPHWECLYNAKEWIWNGELSKDKVVNHTFFLESIGLYRLYITILSPGIWNRFRSVCMKFKGPYFGEINIEEESFSYEFGHKTNKIVEKLKISLSILPENILGNILWSDTIKFGLRIECLEI